ncbi:MAG: pyruvate kinase [Pseudomonadota bacterium]
MRRQRKVKILATLGPASSSKDAIESLFLSGADVFRINMSHTKHDAAAKLYETIRSIEVKHERPIGILADLQGPKLRVGEFAKGPVQLENGATFTLDANTKPGDVKRVHLPHPEILEAVEKGHVLLLDDGKIRLRATRVTKKAITCTVEVGGALSDRKGVSLPDTLLPIAAMTEKDRSDLQFMASLGVDWIALSFVQRPEDMAEARKLAGGRSAVLAKVEKPQAIEKLEEIIDISDAVMVARGDLGVEMPLESVPGLQKRVTRACRRAGKPVVVATQMLESMITAPVPTRAEVSDVATAVYEGADAIMLSAESAVGKYAPDAVATMDRIARNVEADSNYRNIIYAQRTEPEATAPDAISAAAHAIADTLRISAIVNYTSSGSTGLRMARERPFQPLIALTPKRETARRLALVWGLHCVLTDDAKDEDDMVDRACRIAFQEGFAKPGERIIVTAGVPFGTPGATNLLRIAFIGAKADLSD